TYTLPVEIASMDEVVEAIQEACGGAADLSVGGGPLPFPSQFEAAAVERRLGPLARTPLRDGVRATVETFRQAVAAGRLDADRLLKVR
ncbi:MAG TPA: hypothetical protein VKF59_17350, partial [Candidatus Dormibacteraeota bacterium]|nr:hypothetical protein [Candidatus Dormibacteraeota bacterium]